MAGFVRQAHSGFFHLLPLGLRVQEKLERLIDKHMTKLGNLSLSQTSDRLFCLLETLGASKVSLSSFSSPALWKKSGRYRDDNPELFQLQDRRGAKFLLSPTHEEEITAIVENAVNSYKQLPLMLYQISRKYRDEPRPRQGLLRTREFIMKDLYTFDATPQQAMKTYALARKAYDAFFDELRIPYLVADADSGSIGGNLSHEYHIPSLSGEDTVISCGSCTYAMNEELAKTRSVVNDHRRSAGVHAPYRSWFGISNDRTQLVEAILPQYVESNEFALSGKGETQLNPYLIRSLYPDLDLSIEHALNTFIDYWGKRQSPNQDQKLGSISRPRLIRIFDYRIPQSCIDHHNNSMVTGGHRLQELSKCVDLEIIMSKSSLDLTRIQEGDECPKCGSKSLKLQQAVELGHTFLLNDRYSRPMDAKFTTAQQVDEKSLVAQESRTDLGQAGKCKAWFQMGCHGIGISRIIAAVADALADKQGLLWPRVMAPFDVAVLANEDHKAAAEEIWDILTRQEGGFDPVDVVLDDRDKGFGWKLKDADLIGFPVVIVLGSIYAKEGFCEVSIRRLGSKEKVEMKDLREYVGTRMAQI
ncbi:MAG: hypothetical protein Q9218_001789 [Villophora microphyllina]